MEQWQLSHDDFDAKAERWQFDGPSLGSFPRALSSAPVKFINIATKEVTELRFVAGLMGVCESERGLEPEIGWAPVHGSENGTRFTPEHERGDVDGFAPELLSFRANTS